MKNDILRTWNIKRYSLKKQFKDRKYPSGNYIWKVQLREAVRRDMMQNVRDLKRRGKSNREGANNRRFREWKASQPKILFSAAAFEIVA